MPSWWLPVVQAFLMKAYPLVVAGARVTSWRRSLDHNRAVGGDPRSQHLLGLALDLVPLDGDMAGLESSARLFGFGYVINEGDHVHVQAYPAGVIPQWIYDTVAA